MLLRRWRLQTNSASSSIWGRDLSTQNCSCWVSFTGWHLPVTSPCSTQRDTTRRTWFSKYPMSEYLLPMMMLKVRTPHGFRKVTRYICNISVGPLRCDESENLVSMELQVAPFRPWTRFSSWISNSDVLNPQLSLDCDYCAKRWAYQAVTMEQFSVLPTGGGQEQRTCRGRYFLETVQWM